MLLFLPLSESVQLHSHLLRVQLVPLLAWPMPTTGPAVPQTTFVSARASHSLQAPLNVSKVHAAVQTLLQLSNTHRQSARLLYVPHSVTFMEPIIDREIYE